MNDQPNLRQFLDEMSSFSDEAARRASAGRSRGEQLPPIGQVVEIAGSGSQIRMDAAALAALAGASRPVGRHVRPGRQPGQDGRRQRAG